MGPRPIKDGVKYSIERKDVNGDYCKENCKWGTTEEQGNNKRNTIYLVYNGIVKTLKCWSDELQMDIKVMRHRVTLGWSDEEIITTPIGQKRIPDKKIIYNGQEYTLLEWSKILNIKYSTLYSRFQNGMSVDEAFTIPVKKKHIIDYDNGYYSIKEFSELTGLHVKVINTRINQGLSGLEIVKLYNINFRPLKRIHT